MAETDTESHAMMKTFTEAAHVSSSKVIVIWIYFLCCVFSLFFVDRLGLLHYQLAELQNDKRTRYTTETLLCLSLLFLHLSIDLHLRIKTLQVESCKSN